MPRAALPASGTYSAVFLSAHCALLGTVLRAIVAFFFSVCRGNSVSLYRPIGWRTVNTIWGRRRLSLSTELQSPPPLRDAGPFIGAGRPFVTRSCDLLGNFNQRDSCSLW